MASLPSLRPLRTRPVPPPLFVVCLAAAAVSCNVTQEPTDPVRASFPKYAAAVLESGSELERTQRGFEVIATDIARAQAKARVTLPSTGDRAIHFVLRDQGEVRVREVGLQGEGHIVDRAVTYDLPGGKSYWSATPNGAEEWLLLEPGAAPSGRPAAIWEVAGATPVQRGEAIALHTDAGRRVITVTAPAAYLADGTKAPVKLSVRGSTIELHVETNGQLALVDPAWNYVANMNFQRYGHVARLLTSGRVMVAGGWQESGGGSGDAEAIGEQGFTFVTTSAEEYDPIFDQWNVLPDMIYQHAEHAMVTRPGLMPPNGGVFVIAGRDDFGNFLYETEEWDGASWQEKASLSEQRAAHTATRLPDDRVLVAGGYNDCGGGSGSGVAFVASGPDQLIGSGFCFVCTAEVYDPGASSGSGDWIGTGPLNECRALHTETLLDDGSVLVAGGETFFGVIEYAERWSPSTQEWNYTSDMNVPRAHHTATKLNDGTVLVTGGTTGDFPFDSAEIYDPVADTWTPVGNLAFPRAWHAAALMSDGKVLVTGGYDFNGPIYEAEIYDPMTGQFTLTATMNEGRGEHTETLLQDGNVLVSGGQTFFEITSSAEIFYPIGLIGQPCESDAECESGFCVDDVCCDTICDQPCEACTDAARGFNPQVPTLANFFGGVDSGVGGSGSGDGICAPVFQGYDPAEECADLDPTTCGTIGTCDGDGACELWPAETTCDDPSCTGSVVTGGGLCDGDGTCVIAKSLDCAPFACVEGACTETCVDSDDCSALSFCGNGQTCVPKQPDGEPAFDPVQCISGIVADGVCCDTPCDGECQACSVLTGAATDGTCAGLSNVGCSDGTACTKNDVCMDGQCVPGVEVVCPPVVGCGAGFVCNASTGNCDFPTLPKKEGDPCDDGLTCTEGEACTSGGECVGGAIECVPGACQTVNACVEPGGCVFDDKPEYTPCTTDDNPCTIEFCLQGECLANSVVDYTPCPGGICLGGACLPDGSQIPTGSGGAGGGEGGAGAAGGDGPGGSGSGASGGGEGGGANGGNSAAGGNEPAYELFGGLACSASGAGGSSGAGGVAGVALAALGLAGLRRRRRRG